MFMTGSCHLLRRGKTIHSPQTFTAAVSLLENIIEVL